MGKVTLCDPIWEVTLHTLQLFSPKKPQTPFNALNRFNTDLMIYTLPTLQPITT